MTNAVADRWAVAFAHERNDWETPAALFREIDREFHFTLDVCALPTNAKCSRYFTPDTDGLVQDWGHEICWMNPPYARFIIDDWMAKAYQASQRGATVVCLTFARTDTDWFHRWVLGKAEIRFIKGRVRFAGAAHSAPAPSILIIYRPPLAG